MGVSAEHRVGHPGAVGGDEHDLALDTVLYHVPTDVLHKVERAVDVGVHDLLQILPGKIIQMGVVPGGGGVDKDIQTAEGIHSEFDQLFHLFLFTDIAEAELNTIAITLLGQQIHGRFLFHFGVGGDDHLSTTLQQTQSNVKAQTGAAAGNQGDFAFYRKHILQGTGNFYVALQHGLITGLK